MNASDFFTREQQAQIRAAIAAAEENTSGEIRVHLETGFTGGILDRAAWIFRKIGMHRTKNRNGVLFYLAVENKQFAVIGDWGINRNVPEDFWDKTRQLVEQHFKNGQYAEGLAKGILMAGDQLKEHFPHRRDDINELPDEISYDIPE